MMGRSPPQQSLCSADTQYLDFVGEDTFCGFLARHGRELLPDEEFAAIHCDGFGRPSVPPGMLAIALLLQAHDSRDVDWDDGAAREAFLTELIANGERVLAMARQIRSTLDGGSEEDERIAQAAELPTVPLWQDVEPTERGHSIKRATAKDRVPSVEDPEHRHGHTSQNHDFMRSSAFAALKTASVPGCEAISPWAHSIVVPETVLPTMDTPPVRRLRPYIILLDHLPVLSTEVGLVVEPRCFLAGERTADRTRHWCNTPEYFHSCFFE
ncbi:MAG: hypothetical protein ACOX9R_04345 [Armatimonadota bacterium]|jgi:hypothetical protein